MSDTYVYKTVPLNCKKASYTAITEGAYANLCHIFEYESSATSMSILFWRFSSEHTSSEVARARMVVERTNNNETSQYIVLNTRKCS